jgi:hypothetical protein
VKAQIIGSFRKLFFVAISLSYPSGTFKKLPARNLLQYCPE